METQFELEELPRRLEEARLCWSAHVAAGEITLRTPALMPSNYDAEKGYSRYK